VSRLSIVIPRPSRRVVAVAWVTHCHPHAFRAQVAEALQSELSEAWETLFAADVEPVAAPPPSEGRTGPRS
jgi:hypothetical protein